MAEASQRAVHRDKLSIVERLGLWLNWRRFLFVLIIFFFLTSILFPFYWMVSSSFKTTAEIAGREPVYIPGGFRLEAFEELFSPDHDKYQDFAVSAC